LGGQNKRTVKICRQKQKEGVVVLEMGEWADKKKATVKT